MKIAIHQPEHFPYMGFFEKMRAVDTFVILDDVQFVKGNWHNRNRFINKNGDWDFFGVQVEKDAYKKNICDVKIVNGPWKKKTIKKVMQNFSIDLTKIYDSESLFTVNMNSIRWGMSKLDISTPILFSSEMNIQSKNTQRIIDICKRVEATTYLCGHGAMAYIQDELFTDVKLEYTDNVVSNLESIIAL